MKLKTIILIVIVIVLLMAGIAYTADALPFTHNGQDPWPNQMMQPNDGTHRSIPPSIPTPFF